MKKLLLIAAFVHFFIAPFTYHPDNKLVLFWAGQEHGSVWNIWSYGETHFSGSQFNYPPLHFYLDKLQYFVAILLGGQGYYEWLDSPNTQDAYEPQLSQYMFATKFILILFGLAVGYLIYRIAKQYDLSERQAQMAAGLWLFNPIVLYSIPMMGQNDVMAILFFLGGWLALRKNQWVASVLFGLSASIKMYPMIWLPFILLSLPTINYKNKILIFGISIGVYVLTLLPFISNSVFRDAVLQSEINDRFLASQIDLGFSDSIFIVPLVVLLAIYAAFIKKTHSETHTELLSKQSFSVMTVNLLLLGFSHFHVQWFTWIVPFWALWLVTQKKNMFWKGVIASLSCFSAWLLILLLFQDTYLSFGILAPIHQALSNLPSIRDILTIHSVDYLKFNNFAHTWLAVTGIVLLITLFKQQNFGDQQTVPVSWTPQIFKLPQWLSAPLIMLGSLSVIWIISFVAQFIPASLSTQTPSLDEYRPIVSTVTTTITGKYNNFSRVDVYFRNPGLANKEEYTLSISSAEAALLFTQTFSGYNTGDPGVIRFDIPVQSESKGKEYQLTITPVLTQPALDQEYSPLLVGISKDRDETVAVKSFYEPSTSIRNNAIQAFITVIDVIKQLPALFIILLVVLYLAA